MYPELLRLSADGKPLAEFNGGKPVRFDTPGGWHYMHEVNGRLMGYGSFYSHNRAVCYALEGNLDTRFVFPDGFGELGVTPTWMVSARLSRPLLPSCPIANGCWSPDEYSETTRKVPTL